MTQPTPYRRGYDFSDAGGAQPPGGPLDGELDDVGLTLSQILRNLALLQRDDTGLRNGIVGIDALDSRVLGLISGGTFSIAGTWATDTAYPAGAFLTDDGAIYLVMEAHTSTSIVDDLAAGRIAKALQNEQGTRLRDDFVGNAVQTEFSLSQSPARPTDVEVYVDGALVLPDDYAQTGATVTFDVAPANGAQISVFSITWATAPPIQTLVDAVGDRNTEISAATQFLADVGDGAPGKGASLIATEGLGDVQSDLDARPTTAALASSTGGGMVGLTADQSVGGRLEETLSVGDDGATAAAADNGGVISTVLDAQKQTTSISYNATTIPMDPKKSVVLADQYTVKNLVDLWAKTTVVAPNGLNSGMTLASDATDDTLFQFSGSTSLPAWGNQNNIVGGAYNILKAGGALVRKNPAFPRAYNDPGGSFMTNWNITDVSFAGPYGIALGDVYSQQATIRGFHSVGTVDQILSVQGHYILIDGLDKTGFTGSTTEPLVVLGDPDNINPTTNITARRMILDLNGNANKDSVHVINAKNTLIDEYHNELTAFASMLKVTDSFGTRVTRSAFITSTTTGLIVLDNADLTMDQYEANSLTNWWGVFTLDGQSPLAIDRLRQFNSGVVPVVPNIDVKEIQRVTSPNEKRLPIIAKDPIGNLLKNPAFVDGTASWTIDGGATATIVDDNEYIPGGKVLRITYASDQAGFKYINQLIPGMNVTKFDDKAITLTMVGKVTHGGSFSSTSYMGPCDAGFSVTEGRIYADQGLVFGSDIVVDSNGNAYFGIANPRAGWTYDIHFLEANLGRQRSAALPIPMQPLIADPTGGATTDAEARTAINSIIDALQAAGILRTTS